MTAPEIDAFVTVTISGGPGVQPSYKLPWDDPNHHLRYPTMSSSILALKNLKLPLRVSQTSVRYAGRREAGGDPVKDIIRRALYPPNIRNKATPTGTWRPMSAAPFK